MGFHPAFRAVKISPAVTSAAPAPFSSICIDTSPQNAVNTSDNVGIFSPFGRVKARRDARERDEIALLHRVKRFNLVS